MDDIIAEFLSETNEGLQTLDNALVLFERNPQDVEILSEIFRVFHTIKGSCGFVGMERLAKIAHRAEDALGLARDRQPTITPHFITVLLETVDRIKFITEGIEQTGLEPGGGDDDLLSSLEGLLLLPSAVKPDIKTPKPPSERASAFSAAADPELSRSKGNAHIIDIDHAQHTVRVSVDLLEEMMTIVSELVLTRNQMLQTARAIKIRAFNPPLQRLNQAITELQESVMKTRLHPISNAWTKLPRIVRDVCTELNKKIDIEMWGQDTELDRQVLEMIKDPLMHMVRNAADHGIEAPDARLKMGKPEAGRIVLNAYHQGGHIIIKISDDGRGLALEKIKKRALQAELATAEQLDSMSPQQIQQFIFRPGFSTAEQVTSVSGRGVGMDVVRANIQKIGGTIEITSIEGHGTTFTINIPLTLSIITALLVEVAGTRFAFPQLAISELVMVSKKSGARIETIDGAPVLRLRGTLLPLVSLGEHLKIWDKDHAYAHSDDGICYVVVTKAAGVAFGMIVDRVSNMEEIVVKPPSRNLKDVHVFSGHTILGDGSVIMILNPSELLHVASIKEDPITPAEEQTLLESPQQENPLLLFRAGDKTMKAAPLKMVSRLCEVKGADIELSDGKPVVQYMGELLPVFRYDKSPVGKNNAYLIVFEHNDNRVGLVVDQVLDIAKYHGSLADSSDDKILASIILNKQSTDVVNPLWYMPSVEHAREVKS